ncbi:MAG: divalent-cation tolerance protein CutA [Rhodospirillales bacterium]
MDGPIFVYVTASSPEEAEKIGRAAVADRLAACANILPGMRSVYRWQGAIETAAAAVLILKTQRSLLEGLTRLVRERHSYDCPCVVALPIEGGNPAYLDWLAEQTAPGEGTALA